MDSTNQENQRNENFVKFEITQAINENYDGLDTNFEDTKNRLDTDNSNDTTDQFNILKSEQFQDTILNCEEYNIPENLNNREKKQFLRMRGLAYIGGSNKCPKPIEARKLGEPCKSIQCARIQSRHCNEFTEEQRNNIFRTFWYKMNWSEKRLYVREHVEVVEPCRRRADSMNSRRQNTMKFYLSMNDKKLQVCKTMFASTLSLGETFVREWVQKFPSSCSKSQKNSPKKVENNEFNNENDECNEFDEVNDNESFTEELNENLVPTENISENSDKITKELKSESFKNSLATLTKNYSSLLEDQRKEIGKLCRPKYCHNNKCLQINNEQRKAIYNQFWFDMNYTEKLNYIQKNIEVIRTGPIKPNIMDTYYYFLKILKRRYPVCKEMFLSTLGLVEKNVEVICDDYKKYLLQNTNEPVEEDDESENDESQSHNYNLNTKNDDPLDVNIEYVDVNVDIHMEDGNPKLMEINDQSNSSSDEDDENISVRDSDQSTWKNDSENDNNVSDEDDDLNDDCIKEKTFKKKLDIKQKTENFKRNTYSTRSSNKMLIKNEISKASDEEFIKSKNYTENNNITRRSKSKTTQQTKIQLSNGIIIPPEIGPPCNSTLCKRLSKHMCSDITKEQRKILFNNFWHEMSLNDRKEYVIGNIEKFIEFKIQKYKYNLIISKERFQVCKNMFMNTLCLHEICIRNWLNNIENYDFDLTDSITVKKSIKNIKKSNNLITNENTMEKIQILDEFLDSLPKIPPKTFYTQKTNKIYFNENITGSRNVFHMYLSQMREDNMKSPLSKKILMKRLAVKNLTFYKGKKLRQGQIDNDIKISDNEKQYIKRGQQEKYRDKALARKSSPSTILLNIDIFNVKMSPNIKCDADQYDNSATTRLCCYNFTVCNIITLHGMCYWFCETDASNTNNSSFITCLLDYLNNSCKNSQQIIIYGKLNDNRFKNIDMANALLDYSIKMNKIIIQKFLPTNDKFETECDTIYKSIDRKLRTFEIMLPSDYVTASIDARREPCEAKWMNFRVFKDFSAKTKKHRYNKLASLNDESIDNFHAILYKNNGEILYKIDFDDEWSIVPENFKCLSNENIDWPQLYLERRKISAVKYQSLQSLKIQLPRDCHFFYDYLTIEI